MPASVHPQRRLPLAALALLLALPIAPACTGDDNDADDTKPPKDERAEVKAAYLAYWDMGERLLEAPNPDDPEIPKRTTGKARTDLVAGLKRLKQEGLRSSLGERYVHDVVGVELRGDDAALVKDCAVDDSSLVRAANGDVVEQSVVTELLQVRLVLRNESWLVESSTRLGAWEGAASCE